MTSFRFVVVVGVAMAWTLAWSQAPRESIYQGGNPLCVLPVSADGGPYSTARLYADAGCFDGGCVRTRLASPPDAASAIPITDGGCDGVAFYLYDGGDGFGGADDGGGLDAGALCQLDGGLFGGFDAGICYRVPWRAGCDAGTCTVPCPVRGVCAAMPFGAVYEVQCWDSPVGVVTSTGIRVNYSAEASGTLSDAGIQDAIPATANSTVMDFTVNPDPYRLRMPRNARSVSVRTEVDAGRCLFYITNEKNTWQ
ncbi:MAG: hypothetical protein SFW67_35520 [Myxococcaceae bacterium]|nr:hypothetical protein [Myxococcaceae bacterium]